MIVVLYELFWMAMCHSVYVLLVNNSPQTESKIEQYKRQVLGHAYYTLHYTNTIHGCFIFYTITTTLSTTTTKCV